MEEGSQVESEERGQAEEAEQEGEADVANSPSPASAQLPVDPTPEPLSPSAKDNIGGPSDLFGSSDEEDSSISKPKRQRLESDSDADIEARVPEAEVGTQEVPEVEEVGTHEVVERRDEEYMDSGSEAGGGGGSDEELAAELDDLTDGQGQVSGKGDAGEEDEVDDQQVAESSEGK